MTPADNPPVAVASGDYHAVVTKKVDVCVPGNLVDNESWDKPPPGGKMEAFQEAAKKVINDLARSGGIDENTQFIRIVDIFDSYDPATTDPRDLVRVELVSGTPHTCPAGGYNRYTLPVWVVSKQISKAK